MNDASKTFDSGEFNLEPAEFSVVRKVPLPRLPLLHNLEPTEFSVVRKGYDRGEVDSYCWRVSQVIVSIQEELNRYRQRARSSQQESSRAGGEASSDAIVRALLLAQTTADGLIAEAEQEATEIVATAESQAQSNLEDSRVKAHATVAVAADQASRLLADAADQARRIGVAARERLRADITRLGSYRDLLDSDVRLLEGFLNDKRTSLIADIDGLRELIENPEALRVASTPALSGVDVSQALLELAISDDGSPGEEITGDGGIDGGSLGADEIMGEPMDSDSLESESNLENDPLPRRSAADPMIGMQAPYPADDVDAEASQRSHAAGDTYGESDAISAMDAQAAPESARRDSAGDAGREDFLRELRETASAPGGGSSDDALLAAFFEQDDGSPKSSWFGRRL